MRNKLKYYANVFGNDVQLDLQREATKEVRRLSCDLEEAYYAVSFRRILSLMRVLPKEDAINSAASGLIGLSNGTGNRDDHERLYNEQSEVKRLLKIKDPV